MIFRFVILGALATLVSSQFGGEGKLYHKQHHHLHGEEHHDLQEHEHHDLQEHENHDLQEHEHHEEQHEEEHWDEPHYKFEYEVKDEHHGDYKKHRESRKGDDVEGYYSLLEPDGTIREVHYTSAKHAGFNAVVTHHGKPIEHQEEPKHEYHVPEHHHHEIQHHHVPEHHHHEIKHHIPEHHHHEIEHHQVPEYHHHEIKHHVPEHHHHEIEHHVPEQHEEYHHENGFEGSIGDDFGSSNSPVPSRLKPLKQTYSKTKYQRSLGNKRPYSVYENSNHRRRWASLLQ